MDRRHFSLAMGALAASCAAPPRVALPSGAAAVTCQSTPFGGLPFEWITFSASGELTSPPPTLLQDPTITDFIILSHGWNSDYPGALRVYEPLLSGVNRALLAAPSDRTYAALLVLWPSKQFGASQEAPAAATVSSRSPLRATDVSEDVLGHFVEQFAAFAGADPGRLMERAQAAIESQFEPNVSAALLNDVRDALGWQALDSELEADAARFTPDNAGVLLRGLSGDRRYRFGGAREQRSRHQGPRIGVSLLFNSATFWGMKNRAGEIGRGIAAHVLAPVQASGAARIHLIGHSFGARVVTSAAYHAADASKLQTLTMLQGAFSHNALAPGGAFVNAHRKIAGPTLITCTHNDRAVFQAYAIASHLSDDSSRRLGGADDPFGAIGANGAQGIPRDLAAPSPTCMDDPIVWTPGKVHNLNSDHCITDHMDVTNARISGIVASALAV